MKVGLWSTTAGSNNSATPDGWPEGQAPSTLNDCAREMMAAIKTAIQDIDYFDHGFSPTYINANSFSVPGNQTDRLLGGRQLKLFDAATIYRAISTASYTTVTTVQLASGSAVTASLSSFAVSIINPAHSILPSVVSKATAKFTTSSTGANSTYTYNVASISRSATAVYRVTFATPFGTTTYVPILTFEATSGRYASSASASTSAYKFTIVGAFGSAAETDVTVHMTVYGV